MSVFNINRWRSGGTASFRSAHSAKRLAQEAERFDMGEYLDRHSAYGAQKDPPAKFDPKEAIGVQRGPVDPDEEIRTWGNSVLVNFTGVADQVVTSPTQLIRVARRRPTTFSILTVVTFGSGWAGIDDACTLLITYILGVGQAQCTFYDSLDCPVPDNGVSYHLTRQYPLNAVQCQAQLIVPSQHNVGAIYAAQIAQFAAPVME
jgi:hypothetical protein